MEFLYIFTAILIIVCLVIAVYKLWSDLGTCRSDKAQIRIELETANLKVSELEEANHSFAQTVAALQPYTALKNADTYAAQKVQEGNHYFDLQKTAGDQYLSQKVQQAERIVEEQKMVGVQIVEDAKAQSAKIAETIKEKATEAERVSAFAHAQANRTIDAAKLKAEQIAGDAYYSLENARNLEATASAMRDTIKGYGDEYLVDTESWVDTLSDNWGHKEAGQELKAVRIRIKQMIVGKSAAECDYADATRRDTALSFVIDAFNGKVDSILAKARHKNYGVLEKQIRDAYQIVNHHGVAFRNARITELFLNCRLQELYWLVGVKELERRSREEQLEIKREMREEARAKREYEKAIKEAEKEEEILNKALAQARAEMQIASDAEKVRFERELAEIEAKLIESEERNQRAISMAQQTRRGHVYIISNVGSFGREIYKIGMTRRLEPLDRVKELGDASVPFSFDVHAMIFCEDAPSLEKELHNHFEDRRVNKVNHRKEFFRVSISEVRDLFKEKNLGDIHWTLEAEAMEYRETLAIQRKES